MFKYVSMNSDKCFPGERKLSLKSSAIVRTFLSKI